MTTAVTEQGAVDTGLPFPGVGIHYDVPEAIYHALGRQFASNSRLSQLMRSPAHLKAYLDGARDDDSTDATRMGSAIHCAILEPDHFGARYGCASQGIDRRTKAGKDEWAELQFRFGPDRVLKADEHRVCLAVRDAVLVHSAAKGLLRTEHKELTLIADHDGLLVKSRLDAYNPYIGERDHTIVDIKTTQDASPRAFERTIFARGYHRQGALYIRSARMHKLPVRHFVIIAVEKDPPYAVAVYRLDEGTIDAGAQQVAKLIPRYRECLATDTWPGYGDGVQDIALPAYAWSQIDEDVGGAEP